MPLTDPQINDLADGLDRHFDDGRLLLLATDLGVALAKLTIGLSSLRERAIVFIQFMNTRLPPRDAEMLEMIRTRGNAALQAVVNKLLTPTFFPPTGNPHDAIVLGRTAFIARDDLRQTVREFTERVDSSSSRMLVVRGVAPGGKSYTWQYLRHLALATVGAQPFRHRLRGKGQDYTPLKLFRDVFAMLDLNASQLPSLSDDPQLARLDALLAVFKGKIVGLTRRSWLVIDDLNEPGVTPAIREAAFEIARSAEEIKPQSLWVVLLGYNNPILDPELRYIPQDDAEYPNASYVASYFRKLSDASTNPLKPKRETEIAQVLFQKYPTLDQASMTALTIDVERIGQKLFEGQQP